MPDCLFQPLLREIPRAHDRSGRERERIVLLGFPFLLAPFRRCDGFNQGRPTGRRQSDELRDGRADRGIPERDGGEFRVKRRGKASRDEAVLVQM